MGRGGGRGGEGRGGEGRGGGTLITGTISYYFAKLMGRIP